MVAVGTASGGAGSEGMSAIQDGGELMLARLLDSLVLSSVFGGRTSELVGSAGAAACGVRLFGGIAATTFCQLHVLLQDLIQ